MKKPYFRGLSLILIVTMLAMLSVGCTKEKTPKEETPASTEQTPKDNNTDTASETEKPAKKGGAITLMASQNWIKDVDRELFKKFEEESGIEVKILLTPDNGYATLLGTSLSGGSNAVDVFMYPAGSEMVSAGIPDVALDLSGEKWVTNLEPWATSANSYEGKILGFSTWGIDYEGMLYNKSYFKENNLEVPTTWEDFIALLDTIKGLGKTPLYEGINGVWHTQSWLYAMTPAMLAEDADFILKLNATPDNKFGSSAVLKEGLTQLYDLFSAKEGGKPKYYTNDGQSEDWFGSYPALVNRDVVMMFTYSAYVAELEAKESKDEWGMFPLPIAGSKTGVSNGGGISKYVNKNSKNIDACKAFLDFLAKSENLETYYGARTDLVSAAFIGVKSVKPTSATAEIVERSGTSDMPVMMLKNVLYWDPDMFKYFQGFAEDSVTVDQFINNMDAYRKTLFEAAAN